MRKKNNLFAIKLMFKFSKRRLIHTIISSAIGYFEWLFYSAFFIKFVIKGLENGIAFSSVVQYILICAIVFAITSLYDAYVNNVVFPLTSTIMDEKIQTLIYKKAMNVELQCYEDPKFYDKFTLSINGASQRIITIVNNTFNIIFGVITGIIAFFTMYRIDSYSILFIVFPMLGNFLFGKLSNKISYARYQENIVNERKSAYINRVMYLTEYAKELRLTKVFDLLRKMLKDSVEDSKRIVEKYSIKSVVYVWLQNLLTFALVFEGIMLYSAYRTIVVGSMSLSNLAIMFSIMEASSWIVFRLFSSVLEMFRENIFMSDFYEFLKYKEKIPENQEGYIPAAEVNKIEFVNVSFDYGEKTVLNNISFKINKNETIAIVGHNGAGKTTLIKLLLRLYDPTKGKILVNDIDIKKYNLRQYRDMFAVTFQDYNLFAASVKDNIFMTHNDNNEDICAWEALNKAGLKHYIETFDDGLYKNLTKEFDDNGLICSGGQAQKICNSRVFAKKSQIKIFDEPSSALDPTSEKILYDNIMDDNLNIKLIISHRLSSVKDCDKIIVLSEGCVLGFDSHDELIRNNHFYSEMFLKQSENYVC